MTNQRHDDHDRGHHVATAPDEEEMERLVLAYSPRFRAILNGSRQQIRDGKGIPHDDFWHAVEAESDQAETSVTPSVP